jgi:hypothetical protein
MINLYNQCTISNGKCCKAQSFSLPVWPLQLFPVFSVMLLEASAVDPLSRHRSISFRHIQSMGFDNS